MSKLIAFALSVLIAALAGCQARPEIKPVYGATNPTAEQVEKMEVQRYGSVIGLRPEKEQYYRKLHADVWPAVVQQVRGSNIRNYSIYTTELDGRKYLFSYFEYVGSDFEGDMQKMAENPVIQEWWKETDPCQIQLPDRKPRANWSDLEMVFLLE